MTPEQTPNSVILSDNASTIQPVPEKKKRVGRWKKGESGNPTGRFLKLDPEVKEMQKSCAEEAIRIMHKKIKDKAFISKLRVFDLVRFLELVCDRCGVPKIMTAELTGAEGEPLIPATADLSGLSKETLVKLAMIALTDPTKLPIAQPLTQVPIDVTPEPQAVETQEAPKANP